VALAGGGGGGGEGDEGDEGGARVRPLGRPRGGNARGEDEMFSNNPILESIFRTMGDTKIPIQLVTS
jgi:hypothetical protein